MYMHCLMYIIAGGNIEVRGDAAGDTPLALAACYGRQQVLQFLLGLCADTDAMSSAGERIFVVNTD